MEHFGCTCLCGYEALYGFCPLNKKVNTAGLVHSLILSMHMRHSLKKLELRVCTKTLKFQLIQAQELCFTKLNLSHLKLLVHDMIFMFRVIVKDMPDLVH